MLRTADFIATLAVEAAGHYLDLTVRLPAAPAPDPASPGLVRRILDGLLGTAVPAGWADRDYVLKGTAAGRHNGLTLLRCGAGQGGDRTELAILRASGRVMVLDEAGCSRKKFSCTCNSVCHAGRRLREHPQPGHQLK